MDKKKTHIIYLDLKGAFDAVDRGQAINCAKHHGVRGKMLKFFKKYLTGTKAKIEMDNTRSVEFNIERGVPQGDPLSPTLFIIFINSLLDEIEKANLGIKMHGITTPGIGFADDLCFMAESMEQLNKLIKICEKWCENWGMQANAKKLATMVIGAKPKDHMDQHFWRNKQIPKVEVYDYLGVKVKHNLSAKEHIKNRISKTNAKAYMLHKFLRNGEISTSIKAKIINMYLIPCLTYGLETFAITKSDTQLMDTCINRHIRTIAHLHSRAPIDLVRRSLGIPNATLAIAKIKLGNAVRIDNMQPERHQGALGGLRCRNKKQYGEPD